MRELLTSHVKYLLENPRELQSGKFENPQTRGKFYSDRRADVKKAIEYLIFMAEHLPEQQLEKTFNKETVEPLIHAVLFSYQEEKRPRLKNAFVRNLRVFKIAAMLINQVQQCGAHGIINSPYDTLLMQQRNSIDYTRIIQILNNFIWQGSLSKHAGSKRKVEN